MNELANFFLNADARLMTGALLVASFVLHVLAVNLIDRSTPANPQRYAPFVNLLVRIGLEMVRLVFYIGPLYAALYFGWIDLRSVGLGPLGAEGLRWMEGIQRLLILALAAWGLLMLIWMPYLRATAPVTEHFTPVEWLSRPRRAFEVILMQAHWAFYRGAFALLLNGIAPNATYWGAVAGVGLVMLEVWSDPRVRRYFMQVGQVEWGAWNAGLAVISAMAYMLTTNLWLVGLLHIVLEFTVPHLRAPIAIESNANRLSEDDMTTASAPDSPQPPS